MPSSPKSFKAWPSSVYSRRSTVLILCSLIGLAGFVFGFIAISKQNLGYKCKYTEPKSVSVVWDRKTVTTDNGVLDEGQNRHKVMGFVGIQTGFGSSGRRRAMRNTWFPSDQQGLQKYYLISLYVNCKIKIYVLLVLVLYVAFFCALRLSCYLVMTTIRNCICTR